MVYLCVNCGIIRGTGIATKMWDQCRCGATDVRPQPCVEGPRGESGPAGVPETVKKDFIGFLRIGSNGEADDILFLTNNPSADPEDGKILAELVQEAMEEHGRYLSVRYFTADEPMSIDLLTTELVKLLSGEGNVKYQMHYSDITGYLWTDEDLIVGGHDLIYELKAEVGRFCHLEIEFSKEPFPGHIRSQRVPRVYRSQPVQTPEGPVEVPIFGITDEPVKVFDRLHSIKTEIMGTVVKVEGSLLHILEPVGRTILVDAIHLGIVPWDVEKIVGRRIRVKTEVEFPA